MLVRELEMCSDQLVTSLEGLCRDFGSSDGPKVDFHQYGELSSIPNDVVFAVFGIAQEAIRNCAKHSEAGSACLVLVRSGDELQLSVSDNGKGFHIGSGIIKEGLGFTSMHEWARIVGGSISIYSRKSHGTIVRALIPLNGEQNKLINVGSNEETMGREISASGSANQ